MTDLRALETELLAAVAHAADEPALEAVHAFGISPTGSYWLRLRVSRLDCTQGVSSASPAKRAIQELTPF